MRQLVNFSLKPAVCEGLEAGHPWVFRDKMGPAAQALPDGAWLRLLDSEQMMIGTGIYQAEGGVAIRVLRLGHRPAPERAVGKHKTTETRGIAVAVS